MHEQPSARTADRQYTNCPHCGLTIGSRAPWLAVRYCPRCLARKRAIVQMLSSSRVTEAPHPGSRQAPTLPATPKFMARKQAECDPVDRP